MGETGSRPTGSFFVTNPLVPLVSLVSAIFSSLGFPPVLPITPLLSTVLVPRWVLRHRRRRSTSLLSPSVSRAPSWLLLTTGTTSGQQRFSLSLVSVSVLFALRLAER